MTKNKTLEALQNVKKYHEIQMVKIGSLVSGKSVVDPAPYYKEDCSFGKWIYENEAQLRNVLGAYFYETIEDFHDKWHEEYHKIYEIFYSKPKPGTHSKVFKENKVTQQDLDKAVFYYAELKQYSQQLLGIMTSSKRRVIALNESKFDSMKQG